MDGTQEYEVESVTRARVHDRKGKKITWKYYVKWKGYGWDESTWEPTDSFQGGSEHILESFWERIDTGGRDISDSAAFKKGEELFVSGPPGRKGPKRKVNLTKTQASSSVEGVPSPNIASISAPPLASRKRRRVQISAEDEPGYPKPRYRISTGAPKAGGASVKSSKRRRLSSPGPRRPAPKRMPSADNSQLDADGETDPDVVEVEDELMQVGGEDAGDTIGEQNPSMADGSPSGSKKIAFDDLEHFYSGNPIDIDQSMDEQVAVQKTEARPRLQSTPPDTFPPPDDAALESQVPSSPTFDSPDPLFDSPSRFADEAPEIQRDPVLPLHRARAANPLVKLIDATTSETTNTHSRITAKARLMSIRAVEPPSASGSSRNVAKRGGKSGPGRSSSGITTRNRSSLLTATKGILKSVKGKFTGTTTEHGQPDEMEEAPDMPRVTGVGIMVDQDHEATSNSKPGPPPSGDELLKLAGLQTDPEVLADYEDDPATKLQEVEDVRESTLMSTLVRDDLPDGSSVEVAEGSKAGDPVADTSSSVLGAGQETPTPPNGSSVSPTVAPLADEVVKKSIELAKEHLFPSTQTSVNMFDVSQSSFRSTIFGPLYQGSTANSTPAAENEFSTTFKVIFGDSELPLVLKDCGEIKARISDIQIGNSSSSKVALFYSAEDALAMVSTFKSDGTAQVVLDPSAETTQQESFSMFLRRFESSQTLIAPAGKEVCVLYSSENAAIAEKLGAPTQLKGLSRTLLISRASIEDQLAYVVAIMKATAV